MLTASALVYTRVSGWRGLSLSWILVYSYLMRGKSGHWGKPFTKGNANAMRLHGLAIRRSNSADRLVRKQWSEVETKWEMRDVPGHPGVQEQVVTDSPALRAERARQAQLPKPGLSQPGRLPRSDTAELSQAVEAKLARPDTALVPVLQPGEKICYGYELAPGGPWVEAKPPARNPNGLTEAAVLRAQRMFPRRWDGKRPSDRPR